MFKLFIHFPRIDIFLSFLSHKTFLLNVFRNSFKIFFYLSIKTFTQATIKENDDVTRETKVQQKISFEVTVLKTILSVKEGKTVSLETRFKKLAEFLLFYSFKEIYLCYLVESILK